MSSNVFTFGNIWNRNRWAVSAVSMLRPARASHSLPPRMAPKRAEGERHGFPYPQWGLTSRPKIRIGQTKLCHFFKRLSRYCFFNCNRCSFMSNNGHLLIFNAIFIFSHRSNNTFSIAAKSFMVLSRKDVLLICCRLHVLQP